MKDEKKTRAQLIEELAELRQRVAEMEEGKTECEQAESTLKGSAAIISAFYDNAPMMMGVVEVLEDDIRHLSDNTMTARFFGCQLEDMEYQLASKLGAPQDHIQTWIDHYHESARRGGPIRFEYWHEEEETRCLSATVSPIKEIPDDNLQFCYVVEDITERKRMEQTLQKTHDELEKQVEERTAELTKANEALHADITERKQVEEVLQQQNAFLDDVHDLRPFYS